MENQPLGPEEADWDDSVPKDTWRNYGATGRLAGLFAAVTFSALFFPFMDEPWGLPVATLASYSVAVFGLAFRDRNCSLRKPQVQDQLPKFVLIHVPILLLVYAIEAEWHDLAPRVPSWMVERGRKGSLYDWVLLGLLFLMAWGQQRWMRAMLKSRLTQRSHERLE